MIAGLPYGTLRYYYRCFLPDLTGFVTLSCVGSSYQSVIYSAFKNPFFIFQDKLTD